MAKIDLNDSKWCDMVFEKRQKNYGAYDLRKRYSRNLKLSLLLGVLFFSLAVASPLIAKVIKGIVPEEKKIQETGEIVLAAPPPVDKNTPPPPPPPEVPPPPIQSTVKFTPPVIKKDDEVSEDDVPPPQEGIKDEVGKNTQKGNDDAPPPVEDPGIEEGTGAEKIIEKDEPDKVWVGVEEPPEFPGGAKSLYTYISSNIQYPSMARESGTQGTVTLKFVVEKDGSVGDIQVLRGIGAGCDEEAKRVLRAAGKWKAGKQNGKTVRVFYTLPIKFTLQ